MSLELDDLAPPTPLRLKQIRRREQMDESDVADIVRNRRDENKSRADNMQQFHKRVIEGINDQNSRMRERELKRRRDAVEQLALIVRAEETALHRESSEPRYSVLNKAVFERRLADFSKRQ